MPFEEQAQTGLKPVLSPANRAFAEHFRDSRELTSSNLRRRKVQVDDRVGGGAEGMRSEEHN